MNALRILILSYIAIRLIVCVTPPTWTHRLDGTCELQPRIPALEPILGRPSAESNTGAERACLTARGGFGTDNMVIVMRFPS